jgi:hypothetical protein
MITSAEVSQLMMQQQQMFQMASQYSNQASMGYVMNGVGAYGSTYMNQPMDLNLPNAIALPQMQFPQHNSGRGYNYGGVTVGNYGTGNQMSNYVMSGMNTAYSAATMGATAFGAYAGYKMGGMGGALRGAVGFGGLPLMAGAMAADHVFGNMIQGNQEQHGIYSTLGSNFNFINSGSRTGRGFSRNDAKAISDMTREMAAVPEMLTSMGELNRIMNSISQMGVMQGVRNAQEFGRRFRDTLGTFHRCCHDL